MSRRDEGAVAPGRQLAVVIVATLGCGAIGAWGLGWIFEAILMPIPASDAVAVRLSLAVSFCAFAGFLASAVRILRGLPPVDLTVPDDWAPWLAVIVAAIIGALVGISIFR